MEWVIPGLIMALITAGITYGGLRAQRAKPERKWPVIAVGLLAGLVAGLAIIQAIWLGDRHPARRKLIDRLTVLVASGLMLAVAYSLYGPPFGIGTPIESGRIARPESGYAITIPADWRVEDVSEVEELFGEVVEPGFEPELLALDGEAFMMVATLDAGEQVPPGFVAIGVTSQLKADPLIEDVSWEQVELGGFSASRVDATLFGADGAVRDAPMEMSLYMVSADERDYQWLTFYAAEAPADRWLGIAETIEYE